MWLGVGIDSLLIRLLGEALLVVVIPGLGLGLSLIGLVLRETLLRRVSLIVGGLIHLVRLCLVGIGLNPGILRPRLLVVIIHYGLIRISRGIVRSSGGILLRPRLWIFRMLLGEALIFGRSFRVRFAVRIFGSCLGIGLGVRILRSRLRIVHLLGRALIVRKCIGIRFSIGVGIFRASLGINLIRACLLLVTGLSGGVCLRLCLRIIRALGKALVIRLGRVVRVGVLGPRVLVRLGICIVRPRFGVGFGLIGMGLRIGLGVGFIRPRLRLRVSHLLIAGLGLRLVRASLRIGILLRRGLRILILRSGLIARLRWLIVRALGKALVFGGGVRVGPGVGILRIGGGIGLGLSVGLGRHIRVCIRIFRPRIGVRPGVRILIRPGIGIGLGGRIVRGLSGSLIFGLLSGGFDLIVRPRSRIIFGDRAVLRLCRRILRLSGILGIGGRFGLIRRIDIRRLLLLKILRIGNFTRLLRLIRLVHSRVGRFIRRLLRHIFSFGITRLVGGRLGLVISRLGERRLIERLIELVFRRFVDRLVDFFINCLISRVIHGRVRRLVQRRVERVIGPVIRLGHVGRCIFVERRLILPGKVRQRLIRLSGIGLGEAVEAVGEVAHVALDLALIKVVLEAVMDPIGHLFSPFGVHAVFLQRLLDLIRLETAAFELENLIVIEPELLEFIPHPLEAFAAAGLEVLRGLVEPSGHIRKLLVERLPLFTGHRRAAFVQSLPLIGSALEVPAAK